MKNLYLKNLLRLSVIALLAIGLMMLLIVMFY